jgi:hypothetical protein
MTAQISDQFQFEGDAYALAGVCGSPLFDPVAHGFTPVANCSACWRGYVCGYAVDGQQLILDNLGINHAEGGRRDVLPLPAPASFAYTPMGKNGGSDMFSLHYEGLHLPVPFSGGLLIANQFIREFYVHMGFHPAWKYRRVHELIFENGRLLSHKDLSDEIASHRAQFANKEGAPDLADKEALSAWIASTFSLQYDR